MWLENYVQSVLNFQRILCKMESEKKFWKNFDSFTNTYVT